MKRKTLLKVCVYLIGIGWLVFFLGVGLVHKLYPEIRIVFGMLGIGLCWVCGFVFLLSTPEQIFSSLEELAEEKRLLSEAKTEYTRKAFLLANLVVDLSDDRRILQEQAAAGVNVLKQTPDDTNDTSRS